MDIVKYLLYRIKNRSKGESFLSSNVTLPGITTSTDGKDNLLVADDGENIVMSDGNAIIAIDMTK